MFGRSLCEPQLSEMKQITMYKKLLLLFTLLLVLTLSVYAQDDTPEPLTLEFEDITRTYMLHVPENLDAPAPLILVLHGRTGDGATIERYTAFSDLADREGFIVAYPDGLNGEWNYPKDVPGFEAPHDDTAFLIALVDHIASEVSVDLARVYVAGVSNGGFMAQRIACSAPTRFAGFASVAAAGFGGMPFVCMEPGIATAPILLMHGTADDNVPWDGLSVTQDGKIAYITYPVPDTLAYWAEFNDCGASAESEDLPESGRSPGTSVRILRVECPEDAPVVLYAVRGGGHNWPTKHPRSEREIFDKINRDIDATEEIWAFFAGLQRVQPESTAAPTP